MRAIFIGGHPLAQVRLGHFVLNFNTVMENGGNSRVKLALKPPTFSARGTTLLGWSMEFVSSRLLAANDTASPSDSIFGAPLI